MSEKIHGIYDSGELSEEAKRRMTLAQKYRDDPEKTAELLRDILPYKEVYDSLLTHENITNTQTYITDKEGNIDITKWEEKKQAAEAKVEELLDKVKERGENIALRKNIIREESLSPTERAELEKHIEEDEKQLQSEMEALQDYGQILLFLKEFNQSPEDN